MKLIFLLIPLVVVIPIGIYYYFYLRRITNALCIDANRKIVKIILIILSLLICIQVINIFGLGALIVEYWLAFIVVTDLLYLLLKKIKISSQIERLYQLGIIPMICTSLVLSYSYFHMKDIKYVHYDIPTTKAISNDYRIAVISDLHFPNTMDSDELKSICLEISKQNPDIVVLAGDIVDEKTTKEEMQETFQILSQLDNRLGIFYVYGNHDRAFLRSSANFSEDELHQSITESGITILKDDVRKLTEDFWVVGREDAGFLGNSGRMSSQELYQLTDADDFVLLVDHQPKELDVHDSIGYDLQISGHTHGGQMFPVGLITDLLGFGEMNYGIKQMNHMYVVVTSGIGGWGYPLRSGSQSEYVILDIQKA